MTLPGGTAAPAAPALAPGESKPKIPASPPNGENKPALGLGGGTSNSAAGPTYGSGSDNTGTSGIQGLGNRMQPVPSPPGPTH